jgi:hypothetical protein
MRKWWSLGLVGVLAVAGCGEKRTFNGSLDTKVKRVADYTELTSGSDETEISFVKKSEQKAVLEVKKTKPSENKLFLETCSLALEAAGNDAWRLPATTCKTDKSNMTVYGTLSLSGGKMLLQLTGDFADLRYYWRFEAPQKAS